MPLSKFQKTLFALLKQSRNPESYVAGGTAIHRAPKSLRYSSDIDFFHDTDEAVTTAFQTDCKVLEANKFGVKTIIAQPSFYRVIVEKDEEALRLEWVRDTAFRFFPIIEDDELGYRLHDADLVINKSLALANRSEKWEPTPQSCQTRSKTSDPPLRVYQGQLATDCHLGSYNHSDQCFQRR